MMLACVDTGKEKVDPLAWGIAVFDGHLTKRYHRIREGIPSAWYRYK